MPRSADAKQRRKEARKEAKAKAAEANRMLEEEIEEENINTFEQPRVDGEEDSSSDSDEEEEETAIDEIDPAGIFGKNNNASSSKGGGGDKKSVSDKIKKGQKKRKAERSAAAASAAGGGDDGCGCPHPSTSGGKGIKKAPLILLILMTGTTILPALLYAGDWLGGFIQKNHIMGSLGHKLGIGPSPKKRVLSFYEKHDPNKIADVPTILAKHYGDYPKLVKKLERKYQDYGYFLNWEQDEAPMTLAKDKLQETYEELGKQWQRHCPRPLKTAVRNARHNVLFVYKKGRRIWKKKVWPILEPFLGVPDGAEAQKRKDAKTKRKETKGRRRNTEFRDEEDEF